MPRRRRRRGPRVAGRPGRRAPGRVPARRADPAALPRLDARLPDEPERLGGDGRAPADRRLRGGAVDRGRRPRRHQHLRDPRGRRAEGDRPAGPARPAQGGEPGHARGADRLLGPRAGPGRAAPPLSGGRPVPATRRGARARRPARAGVGPGADRGDRRDDHGRSDGRRRRPITWPGPGPARSGQGTVARGSAIAAWLPIIYGCDKTCTYCIVPFSRGPERSRPFDDILDEARALAAAGYREVTLLGQNVNSYGHDLAPEPRFAHVDAERWAGRQLDLAGRPDLAELIRAIDGLRTADGRPAIGRLRFVTSHPWDLSDRLIAALADCASVCEHLHLPVQSGSDAVLRRMGRQYTIEHYLERLARIREAVPGIAISTDIIVGFCGETEAQFEETLALLETVRYDQVFAAAYSPRPGTPATHLADDVPAADKRRRLNALLAVQEAIGLERNQAWLGREVEVLVDAVTPPREPRPRATAEPAADESAAASPAGRASNKLVHLAGDEGSSGARSSSGSSTPARTRCEARSSGRDRGPAAHRRRRRDRHRQDRARDPPRRGDPRRTAVPWRSSRPTRARSSAASTSARPRSTPRTGRASRTTASTSSIPTSRSASPTSPRHARGVLADLAPRRRRRDPRRRDRALPARRRARPRHRRAAERPGRPRPARGRPGRRRPARPRRRASQELAPALAAGVDLAQPAPRRPGARDRRARGRRPAARRRAATPARRLARAWPSTRARTPTGSRPVPAPSSTPASSRRRRALRERFDPALPAFSAIGYREAWAVLDGELTRDAGDRARRPAERRVRQAPADLVPLASPTIDWLDATDALPDASPAGPAPRDHAAVRRDPAHRLSFPRP